MEDISTPNPLLQGLELTREPEPFAIVIFGVTGDLTRKKLIPALFSLFVKEHISRFRIIGFARRPWGKEGFREQAADMLDKKEFQNVSSDIKNTFLSRLEYIQSPFEEQDGYARIDEYTKGFHTRIYYLSTPPNAYEPIIEGLGNHGLQAQEHCSTRIIVEKPFGRDLASARKLNMTLSKYFQEEQIYRIDHYLGKETVQNLMVLRFGNGIFEPIWNNRYIDHVQITVSEKIGVGTRGNYYEQAGALRDMVQNHVFQLLSLTAMEPPNDLRPDSIRNEKVKVLSSLRPITYREVGDCTVRGQYAEGVIDGQEVPGYREEKGVSEDSRTETFVALKLFLDTWRWAGVPFFLRSGKRLARRTSEIAVYFKEPPHHIFSSQTPTLQKNHLIIRIQPDEGMTMVFNAKIPGYTTVMRPVKMDFFYGRTFGETPPEAYERLLLDAMIGDSTLYTRRDEIESSWGFITRILKGWEEDDSPIPQYRAGGAGPEETRELLGDEKRRWSKL
ncbi:MAG: glucose-6-phosphate dehydrogenase [Spirochaetales bacterium]|nr:glucose-6-phosphate dehydrogenase [Spirochaetales bacterium]MCF7938110.1 glucose-6-phosphate dehydrogenase [Spirochaetales bacterium]